MDVLPAPEGAVIIIIFLSEGMRKDGKKFQLQRITDPYAKRKIKNNNTGTRPSWISDGGRFNSDFRFYKS